MYMAALHHVRMKHVTVTELRRNIFRLLDETIATGEPIVVNRKGRKLILRTERPRDAESEGERAELWRKFWEEPPPPGWESIDLSLEDIKAARTEYWHWDQEPELDE
jgi:hypothetical protein